MILLIILLTNGVCMKTYTVMIVDCLALLCQIILLISVTARLRFITLRKSTTFRKVYWSVPFVCLSVCLLLCEKPEGPFSQSILVSTVCLFVCHTSYRSQFCTDQDFFCTVDSAYPANFTFFFCKYRPTVNVIFDVCYV